MRKLILAIVIIFIFSACSEKPDNLMSVHLGKAKYYKPFLLVKSDTTILEKSFLFEFNDYAKEKNSKVYLSVVDSEGNSYPGIGSSLILWYNGNRLHGNTNQFEINSSIDKGQPVTFGFQFLPGAKEAKHYLFFKIAPGSTIDRVGNFSLTEDLRVMKLECRYDVVWNPLLIGLLTFLLLIITLLVIWFALLRNKFYPKIRGIRNIQVISPYFRSYTIARKTNIIFSNINANQNKLTKIFKGETIFAVNEVWDKPFTVFPGKRKGQLKFKLPNGYTIVSEQTRSMPRHLERFGSYEIKTDKRLIIKIKVL